MSRQLGDFIQKIKAHQVIWQVFGCARPGRRPLSLKLQMDTRRSKINKGAPHCAGDCSGWRMAANAAKGVSQPLGQRSSGKKRYCPIFLTGFSCDFALAGQALFKPAFSLFKSDLRGRSQRGDPFSQPSGSSAW